MNNNTDEEKPQANLQTISTTVQLVAQSYKGDMLALLRLLRMLENLHQEIRDDLFQETLPTSRQALYTLLRDIETEGGWPYIPRMKLKLFLANLEPENSEKEFD
jgi:hypothetical protein